MFLIGVIIFIMFYLLTLLFTCIDRYRLFNGGKIKNYFNEDYYEGSLYNDDFINMASLIPIYNILFIIFRSIYLFFMLIKWLLGKIGFIKFYNRLINMDIK